jgi:hypothetical protein
LAEEELFCKFARFNKNMRLNRYLLLLSILLIGGCGSKEILPPAPDYTNPLMWTTVDQDPEGTGADIFYLVSTWEKDWTDEEGHVIHYADVWNPKHRERMSREIDKAAAYMAPGNRFYSPYYRHTTIEAYQSRSDSVVYARTRPSMKDVCHAFDYFQQQRNHNRPFIIAGFSQGAQAVVELLKYMDAKTYSELAGAYVMGYKITDEDLASCSQIKPAQGADDVGVTICYNTVKDVKYIIPIISDTRVGINPVNWAIDATPAILHDTITVTLSPEYHVVVTEGYAATEYPPMAGLINMGDIHSCEPWLYSECIKENMDLRARKWREQQ